MNSLLPKVLQDNYSRWWTVGPLAPADISYIESKGKIRNQHGQSRGMKSKTEDNSDRHNILGFAGEWAASLVLVQRINQITANTKKDLNKPDLGEFVDVKTASGPNDYLWNICVNMDQLKDDRAYVLVLTAWYPEWLPVIGWAWGYEILNDAKVTESKKNGNELFVYPRHKLRPMDSLLDILRFYFVDKPSEQMEPQKWTTPPKRWVPPV